MSRIGMNPDEVRSFSAQINGQLGVLDGAQLAVALAGAMSANPLAYPLSAGELILSPWSIAQATHASVEIINARASAQELVGKLLAEAGAQEWASSDIDALYYQPIAWKTPDASKDPVLDPADFLDPLLYIKKVVSTVTDYLSNLDSTLEALKDFVKPVYDPIKKWVDDLPPWITKLGKFSKILPFVGAGMTTLDLAIALYEGDVPGAIRNGGSLLIDGLTAVLAPTGIGALIGAAVGYYWDTSWAHATNLINFINDPETGINYFMEHPWMIPNIIHSPILIEEWGPYAD